MQDIQLSFLDSPTPKPEPKPNIVGIYASAGFTPEAMAYFPNMYGGGLPGWSALWGWFQSDGEWARVQKAFGEEQAAQWVQEHGLRKETFAEMRQRRKGPTDVVDDAERERLQGLEREYREAVKALKLQAILEKLKGETHAT